MVLDTAVIDLGIDVVRVGWARDWKSRTYMYELAGAALGISKGAIVDFAKFKQGMDIVREKLKLHALADVYLVHEPHIPMTQLEDLGAMFFDEYNIAGIYIGNDAVAILAATGLDTGVVVRLEGGGLRSMPTYKGFILLHAVPVSIASGAGVFTAPYHELVGSILESIMKCDVDIRSELFANIVLAGAFASVVDSEVLQDMIQALAPSGIVVDVRLADRYQEAAWIGAAKLALANDDQYISRLEYDEAGRNIISVKCS